MKPMAACRHKLAIGSVLAASNSMSTGRHPALSRRQPTPRLSVAAVCAAGGAAVPPDQASQSEFGHRPSELA
jgi:hypothetical protein